MMENTRVHLVPGKAPLDPEEKLTISEAAILCGVEYHTFYGWVRKGAIPHLEIGPFKTIRVLRRDVMTLIREAVGLK